MHCVNTSDSVSFETALIIRSLVASGGYPVERGSMIYIGASDTEICYNTRTIVHYRHAIDKRKIKKIAGFRTSTRFEERRDDCGWNSRLHTQSLWPSHSIHPH